MKALIALALLFVIAPVSRAAEPEPPPVDGELHVTLKNSEYVKVQVNGEDYDNIEFERNGKVVLIKGLSLTIEHNNVTLLPIVDSLAPAELEVLPKEFKKKRKGRTFYLVATRTVAFDKKSTDAPAPDDTPARPDPVAPPPPEKDDL